MEERTILVLLQGDTVLIRKRPPKGLLASLYEFVNLEGVYTEDALKDLLDSHGIVDYSIDKLRDAKHIFTHVEWHMRGYRIRLYAPPSPALMNRYGLIGATREQIETVFSIPTAYKSFLQEL